MAEAHAARLFHLTTPEAWKAFVGFDGPGEARLEPASLVREGFLHLSYEAQLRGTLEAHFKGSPELVLIEVSPPSVAGELRHEASRGDALFPHLYRPLLAADVLKTWTIRRREGRWSLPAFCAGEGRPER